MSTSAYGNTNVNKELARTGIATIDLSGNDITSREVNGETITLYYFNNSTNLVSTQDYTCTGTVWSASIGNSNYLWLVGLAIDAATGESFFDSRYDYSYNTNTNTFVINYSSYAAEFAKSTQIMGNNASDIEKIDNSIRNATTSTFTYNKYNSGSGVEFRDFSLDGSATTERSMVSTTDFDGVVSYYLPWQAGDPVVLGTDELQNLTDKHQILPDLVNPNYYSEVILVFEFTPGAIPYTFANHFSVIINDGSELSVANIVGNMITSPTEVRGITIRVPSATYVNADPATFYEAVPINFVSNPGFWLTAYDGSTNPASGDGTLIITPYFRTRQYIAP